MKKLIVFLCVSLFTLTVVGQVKFTVPTPTDAQKYQSAAWQWHGAYIAWIHYGKSLGKSVEDIGASVGDILKLSWNKEAGFEVFVNGMLYVWVTFVPDGVVEILEQTDTKIVFIIKSFNPPVKEGLIAYSVTFEEYMRFWDFATAKLAEFMGSKYVQKNTDEGLIITIEKKTSHNLPDVSYTCLPTLDITGHSDSWVSLFI